MKTPVITVLVALAISIHGIAPGLALGAGDIEVLTKEGGPLEPFSVAFAPDGKMVGVEFLAGNRVFTIDEADGNRVAFLAGVKQKTSPKLGDLAAEDGDDPREAHFNGMHDLAIAPNGDIYLADTFNYRVRVLRSESGKLEEVCGDGTSGYSGDGGPAREARNSGVYSIALNADGTRLYLADLKNRRIRVIDLASGEVSTAVGSGENGKPKDGTPALEAPLPGPRAVAVDAEERIYIVSREGNALRVVGEDGNLRTVVNAAGEKGYGGDGGEGLKAKLSGPKHACIDEEGRVVIADTENNCIRRYDPDTGRIVLLAGVPGKKGWKLTDDPKTTELNRPHGVRVHGGFLYISDSYNNRVLKVAYK